MSSGGHVGPFWTIGIHFGHLAFPNKKCFRETVLCTLYILDRVQISKTCRFLQYFGENSPLQGGKRDFALIHSNPRYACLSTPRPHCSHTRSKGGYWTLQALLKSIDKFNAAFLKIYCNFFICSILICAEMRKVHTVLKSKVGDFIFRILRKTIRRFNLC